MENNFRIQCVLFLSALIPISTYFYIAYEYSVNIPFLDEYNFLNQFTRFINQKSLESKLSLFFSQHNEHRLAFDRLVFLIFYTFSGQVNFKLIPLAGNAALPLLLYLFLKVSPPLRKNLFLAIPIIIFLFQLQHWENMKWGVASLSNFYVLVFAGAAFHQISQTPRTSFLWAIFLAILAFYTQGSGIGIFLCGIVYLAVGKKIFRGVIWFCATLLILFLYFFDYEKPWYHPSIMKALIHPDLLAKYFLSFLGSSVSFDNKKIAFILGLAGFSYYIFLIMRKYYSKNPPIFFLLSFILLAAVMATMTRSGLGVEQALSSRYRINSILFWILIYISSVEIFINSKNSQKLFSAGAILFSLIFYGFSFQSGVSNLNNYRTDLTHGLNQWFQKNKGLSFPYPLMANATLLRAINAGIYHPPIALLDIKANNLSRKTIFPSSCKNRSNLYMKANFNILPSLKPSEPYPLIRMEGIIHFPTSFSSQDSQKTYLLLKSEKKQYTFTTRSPEVLKDSVYFNSDFLNMGFIALIPLKDLDEGRYEVGLCHWRSIKYLKIYITKEENRLIISPTPHQRELPSTTYAIIHRYFDEQKRTFLKKQDSGHR